MRWIILLIFFIACSKEKSNDQGELQATPSATGEPTVSVPNVTPDAVTSPVKVGGKFIVHDESNCKGVPLDAFDVYFFDPGTTGDDLNPLRKCVKDLKAKGKVVMAYLNVGAAEKYREDWAQLSKYCNKDYDKFPSECWLDVKKPEVLSMMKSRIDKLKELGMDGMFGDNGTIYEDGKDVSLQQNVDYLAAIADYSHSKGMLFGPNNSEKVIPLTIGKFDFYVAEDIPSYGGLENYKDVLGKWPVYHLVYKSKNCTYVKGVTTAYASGLGYSSFKKWCGDYETPVQITPVTPATPVAKPTPTKKVTLPDGIDEASGMVWSAHHNAFIIHNDGDQGILFVVSKEGKLLKTVKTKLPFDDFEAISLFEGKLYLGSIGDNSVEAKQKIIHVLNEKDFSFSETISVKLKEPFNAEGLAVNKDGMFISEKSYEGKTSRFFKYAQGQLTELPKLGVPLIGDISLNSKGELALIHVGAGEILIGDKKIKIKELGQSEAVAWIDDNHIAFTSEGENAEIVTIEVK